MSEAAHAREQDAPRTRPGIEQALVVANDRVAEGVGLVVLESPRVARHIRAGQFVHLRISSDADFLLRRPFSVHRTAGDRIEILFQVVGRGTRALAQTEPGARMDLLGPLGSGWRIGPDVRHALLVGGGLGAAPLGMLAEALADRGVAVTVALGGPTGERLVARELFERVARRVILATDDGSVGERGFVTELSGRILADERVDAVFTCGPEAMSRVVAAQATTRGVACQVSLERLMACGIGVCLSCVCATRSGQARACVDGPVFDAAEVVWDGPGDPPIHGGRP